jgi:hypothetical protein
MSGRSCRYIPPLAGLTACKTLQTDKSSKFKSSEFGGGLVIPFHVHYMFMFIFLHVHAHAQEFEHVHEHVHVRCVHVNVQ